MSDTNTEAWLKRWLFTTNHKDVGLLYIFSACYFGFIGALLALMMRVQLSVPNNTFLTAVYYNQAVTMHGLIMIFWFLSPLAIGLANYFVPLQIGAEDMAFPRLNALSYWLFLGGGMLAVISFFVPGGTANAGWTTYQPLATTQFEPGAGPTLVYLGLVMLAASITLGSVNILVTVFWERGPGVTISKLPMFTWFMLFTIVAMLFSFPTLIAAFALESSDRILGTVFFSNPSVEPSILWDNLFWFFGHPEVYIVLLPGFGVIANVMPVFTGRPIAAKNAILIATGLVVLPLSFGVWMHHMFLTGIPESLENVISVSTIAISVPFDVITLAFIESLFRGRIRFKAPLLFSLGAVVLFIIGGVEGVFLASPVLDRVFRGSYFVVSHFHYVMVGAAIFSLFAGLYYWFPKMSGRMYNERLANVHFVISFIGFNVLYFPMSLLLDMPRRIFTYQNISNWPLLNGIASIGAFIFAGAQILLAWNVIHSWFRGQVAPANPWNSDDLEWKTEVPSASPALEADTSISGGWIGQLTNIATPMTAQVAAAPPPAHAPASGYEEHPSHLSSRPLELSIGTTLVLLGAGLYPYILGDLSLLGGILLVGYSMVQWGLDDVRGRFSAGLKEIGDKWPFERVTKMKLGMWIFLSSEMVLFGSFIAAYIFIRAVALPSYPLPASIHNIPLGTLNTMILVTSGLTMALAVQSIKKGDQRGLMMWLTTTFVLGSTFIGIKLSEWANLTSAGFTIYSSNPTTQLAASAYYFLVGLHGAHVIVGLLMMAYLMKRTLSGAYTKENHETIENFALYWAFVDIVWCFIFPLFYLL
ncbi:MAG TPA: cbb3-type cytochrome c oxidase subunit I [Nitrososphaerales archaeon]|nr:cbb3-type cytochrome c oxidase subunit I [Nitrososphaerales archaeon]